MSILKVQNLTHTYGGNTPFINDAVGDVSFTVEKGEIIGIIGHTGSGKSTLVQHLNGLLKPTDGEIFIEQENIWENPKEIRKVRSKVGLVFQYPEYQLFEETVYKDIAFGPSNMGLKAEEIDQIVRSQLQFVVASTVDTVLETALVRKNETAPVILGDVTNMGRQNSTSAIHQ